MEGYNRCKVIFDPTLTEDEMETRLEAIRLMSGVLRVETEATETIVPGSSRAAASQGPVTGKSQPAAQEGLTIELERRLSGNQIEAQRELIHKALLWGVTSGKLTTDQITSLDPEQMVSIAMEMIDRMPEEEKQSLGRDFGRMAGD